jgi:antitoxin component of RelBE/YafQ-DinJ toxin-antitoxin module
MYGKPPTRYKGIKFKVDDALWEKFNHIKEDLGMTNDSEVIRYLITQYAKRYDNP